LIDQFVSYFSSYTIVIQLGEMQLGRGEA